MAETQKTLFGLELFQTVNVKPKLKGARKEVKEARAQLETLRENVDGAQEHYKMAVEAQGKKQKPLLFNGKPLVIPTSMTKKQCLALYNQYQFEMKALRNNKTIEAAKLPGMIDLVEKRFRARRENCFIAVSNYKEAKKILERTKATQERLKWSRRYAPKEKGDKKKIKKAKVYVDKVKTLVQRAERNFQDAEAQIGRVTFTPAYAKSAHELAKKNLQVAELGMNFPYWIDINIFLKEDKFQLIKAGVGFVIDSQRNQFSLSFGWTFLNFMGGLRRLEFQLDPGWAFLPDVFKRFDSGPDVTASAAFVQPIFLSRRQAEFSTVFCISVLSKLEMQSTSVLHPLFFSLSL